MSKKSRSHIRKLSRLWQIILIFPMFGVSPHKLPGTEGDRQAEKIRRLMEELAQHRDQLDSDELDFLESLEDNIDDSLDENKSWFDRLLSRFNF